MYTEFHNGKQWSSEQAYLKYSSNVKKYLNMSLALESYSDDTGDNSPFKDDAFKVLKEIRANKYKGMPEQEILEKQDYVVERLNKLIDKVGRGKFTFYDDGQLNYNWTELKKRLNKRQ